MLDVEESSSSSSREEAEAGGGRTPYVAQTGRVILLSKCSSSNTCIQQRQRLPAASTVNAMCQLCRMLCAVLSCLLAAVLCHAVQIPADAIAAALQRVEADSDSEEGDGGFTEAGSMWGGDEVRE